jgi:hypothetical protein
VTDERLAEIEARANAATRGPWRAGAPDWRCRKPEHGTMQHPGPPECVYQYAGWQAAVGVVSPDPGYAADDTRAAERPAVAGTWDYESGGILAPADVVFVAHARADVPELVAEVKRLREAVVLLRLRLDEGEG